MLTSVVSANVSTFSDVMPSSSAWIVARIAQLTAWAHWLSPSATAGVERLLGEHLGQDRQRLGAVRVGRAQPGELARVGRPAVALPGDERLLDEVDVLERPDLPGHPEAGGLGGRVALRWWCPGRRRRSRRPCRRARRSRCRRRPSCPGRRRTSAGGTWHLPRRHGSRSRSCCARVRRSRRTAGR